MSDRRYRRLLRSKSLPVALACALAMSVGGCSTWNGLGFGALNNSQAACRPEWPAKVMASVQRAKTSDTSDYVADYSLDDTPRETPKVTAQEIPQDTAQELAQETPKGVPEDIPQDIPQSVAPTPPPAAQSPVEDEQSDIAVALPPPPVAPPPEDKSPAVEPHPDVAVAVPPEPAAPPRPKPSPEVVEVCGATDTACQDDLMTLLADPLHKWIKEKPTSHDERTGVRALAYRVLTPVLACDDLRQGVRETKAIAADIGSETEPGTTSPAATKESKSLEWVQLLSRAVKLELQLEIAKRC